MNQFIENVRDGTHKANGWPNTTYGVSKIGLNAYTRILIREINKKDGILVFSCCPGFCATDMSSHKGIKTAAQGAETPVWLALQPKETTIEQAFYSEKKVIPW